MTYNLIETLSKRTGNILKDVNDLDYEEMVVLPGYHVNMIDVTDQTIMDIITPFIVTPNTPLNVFAGRDDAINLSFTDRDEWLSLGIEEIETNDERNL